MSKQFVPKEQNNFEENLILAGIARFGRDAYADCCDIVKQDIFGDYLKSVIFTAMGRAFEEGSPINITSVFQRTGLSDDRYEEVKQILSGDCFDIKDIRPAAQTLRKKKLKDEAILIHRNCINQLSVLDGAEPVSKLVSLSESALFDLVAKANYNDENGPVKISSIARTQVEEWMNSPTQNVGLPLPWPKFNASIGGGLRSGVHLAAARLKVGKTSIGLMTAIHAASLGVPVLILDTEMMIKDVLPRMLANLSELEINAIERGTFAKDEFKKKQVFKAIEILEGMKISHKNVGGYDFDEILSIIRRWIYTDVGLQDNGEANPMLVVFDYFKVMNARELIHINESQALGFQISKLVDFSKKFNFPCLSFCQLNRDGITKEDSSAVGNSDKLAQLANSLSIFKRKTEDEILRDGPENGNRKIITTDCRYGGETEFLSQYISMMMIKESCILKEVNFKNESDASY